MLLADQDRALWHYPAITAAADLVVRAARMRRPGPCQIQAAIVDCHAEARSWEETDWPQILLLYDALWEHLPSPVVALHRAIAHGQVAGPAAALADLGALASTLASYHRFHAARAQLLRELGRAAEARRADEQALGLTGNPPNVSCSNSRHPWLPVRLAALACSSGRLDRGRPVIGAAGVVRELD